MITILLAGTAPSQVLRETTEPKRVPDFVCINLSVVPYNQMLTPENESGEITLGSSVVKQALVDPT